MLSLLWKQYRFRLVILSYCVLAAACAVKPPSLKSNNLGPDQVNAIAPMPVEVSKDQPLSAPLQAGRSVSRASLVEAVYQSQEAATMATMTEKERKDYQSTHSKEARSRMHKLIADASRTSHPNLPGKKDIDKSLETSLGKTLAYDPKLSTIQDVLLGDGLQCDSGTVLYLLVRLSGGHSTRFKADNAVVLAEDGHFLPGQLLRLSNGRYRLIGIEMTASDHEYIDYGYADKLDSNPRVQKKGLRVLDALTFLAMDAMGDSFKTDQDYADYEKLALKGTAQRYHIPFDKLEAIVAQIRAKHPSSNGTRRRPVAFGDPGNPARLEKRPSGEGYESIAKMPKLPSGASDVIFPKGPQSIQASADPASVLVTQDNFEAIFGLPVKKTPADIEIAKLLKASLGLGKGNPSLRIPADLLNGPIIVGPVASVEKALASPYELADEMQNTYSDSQQDWGTEKSLTSYFQQIQAYMENNNPSFHYDETSLKDATVWTIRSTDPSSRSKMDWRDLEKVVLTFASS